MTLNDTTMKFLVATKRVWQILAIYSATVIMNILCTYLVLVKLSLGIVGTGIAMSFTVCICFFFSEMYLRTRECYSANWVPFLSKETFEECWPYFKLALPCLLLAYVFHSMTSLVNLMAGYLSTTEATA